LKKGNMGKIVGIRFRPSGRVYTFDAGQFDLKCNDRVIVETNHGLGLGTVVCPPRSSDGYKLRAPLKKVCRLATEKDIQQHEDIKKLEERAYKQCLKYINKLKLPMNLVDVESLFDGSKITFYFTADGRIDFRELVKLLAREFRVRIEMHQVGVRNRAKMYGGVGRCGREICCVTFLESFDPVSVRMAKVQNLSLNPTKISGLCGRLMCCLAFEYEAYNELLSELPKCGKTVQTELGPGKVLRYNIVLGRVIVKLEDDRETEIDLEEFKKLNLSRW